MAGPKILPLLVRIHDRLGVEWMLHCGVDDSGRDQAACWLLVVEYLQKNDGAEAFDLLVEIAEKYVEWETWPRATLLCLHDRNFQFAKQFFIYHNVGLYFLPGERPEADGADIIHGYYDAAQNDALIEAWVSNPRLVCAALDSVRVSTMAVEKKFDFFERIFSDMRIPPTAIPDRRFCGERTVKHESAQLQYKVQVLLLEQQKKMIIARQQNAAVVTAYSKRIHPVRECIPLQVPFACHASRDIELQLKLLELRSKRRLLMGQQSADPHNTPTNIGPTDQLANWNAPVEGSNPQDIQSQVVALRQRQCLLQTADPHNSPTSTHPTHQLPYREPPASVSALQDHQMQFSLLGQQSADPHIGPASARPPNRPDRSPPRSSHEPGNALSSTPIGKANGGPSSEI